MSGVKPSIGLVQVLGQAGVDAVHEATLETLAKVGVRFAHPEALEIFAGHGAQVEGDVVKLPDDLVDRALRTAPAGVTLAGRSPKRSVELGQGGVHYTNGFGATFVRDLTTGQTRNACLRDLRDFVILADYFDNVHYCLMPVIPDDAPTSRGYLRAAAIMLQNTDKHVAVSLPTEECLDEAFALGEIATQASGSSLPVFSLGVTSNSPLAYSRDAIVKLLRSIERAIPLRLCSGAMAGATAPATLAGALVVQNAEMLAAMVLAQLYCPGSAVTYGTFTGPMDMRVGKLAMGSPELALICAATAQLCRRYRVPLAYGTGGVSESPGSDVQAGLEKAYTMLFAAMAGVEVIHDGVSGLLSTAMLASYEQMVIDDELASMVNRALKGISLSGETLAAAVIAEVGPGGEYFSHDHTRRHFRQEQFLPRTLVRQAEATSTDGQGPSMLERARDRAREILASHRPAPLPEEALREMEALLQKTVR
jgi:trimethylamine--corrinoid protein Co-methyltransferase